MPVIHVRALEPSGPAGPILAEVSRAAASSIGGDVADVWCTFTALTAQTIGERESSGAGQIVYAQILARTRGAEADAALLEAVGRALAEGFGVPLEDAWVSLDPLGPGQVFAGGAVQG